MKTNTKTTKTATKTTKTAAKPPKTLEAAIKERAAIIGIDPKRVIVASVPVKEVKAAAVALAKQKEVKAEAKPAPAPSKPVETFAAMIERHFKERESVAPFAAKPAPDMVATPSGFVPRSKIAAVVALKARQAREHHDFVMRRASEAFAFALEVFEGDPRAALFYLGITYHDDRGDGFIHVPLFRRRQMLELWARCASVKGYRVAAELVKAA